MKKIFVQSITLLLIFLFSCSGPSSLYNFDAELSSDLASSKTTNLKVNIPRGWFTADDNRSEKIDLWLIKDDYSSTISFIRINPDKETMQELGENNIKKIQDYSKLNNQLAHGDKFIDLLKNEFFELNGRKFEVYQFAGKEFLYRVAVFFYKSNFFECIASVKPGPNQEEISKIFTVQNAVLQSIK